MFNDTSLKHIYIINFKIINKIAPGIPKNPTKIEVGDILSFKGDKDVIITHRVTDISKNNDDRSTDNDK